MSFRWNPLSRRGTGVRWGVESVLGRAKTRRRRASLECLEDRTLLSNSVPVSSAQWSPFGPAPIVGGTTAPGGLPVTGRITGIAASATDAKTIFVTSSGGGVWRTTDGGTTWSPLTDDQATLFMGSIAIAPSDPSVIYAGTGEANNSTNSFYGLGVLKSTDGGVTWTLQDNNGAFDRRTIGKIVVDPGDANTVFAMVSNPGTNGLAPTPGSGSRPTGG
jgi:hypothetical protein